MTTILTSDQYSGQLNYAGFAGATDKCYLGAASPSAQRVGDSQLFANSNCCGFFLPHDVWVRCWCVVRRDCSRRCDSRLLEAVRSHMIPGAESNQYASRITPRER